MATTCNRANDRDDEPAADGGRLAKKGDPCGSPFSYKDEISRVDYFFFFLEPPFFFMPFFIAM